MKISVITAVYNNRTTLAAAFDSALAQDHPDTELIVVDGASTDGTREVIQHYAGRLARIVSEPDRGIYDALNKGIRLATGDAVGFLHSDDVFTDDRVLSRIAAALADSGVDACYGDLRYVRRAIYQRLGDFDTRYRIAADYDCLLRFLGAGQIACAYLPEVLIHMRVGGASNRSLRNLLQKSRENYRALRHNRIGGFGTLLLKNLQKLPQFFTPA